MTWSIRALDRRGDRRNFDCGVSALNEWLEKQASQSVKKRLASVWIATPHAEPATIAGFYALAPWQVAFEDCPEDLRRRLPEYPIYATLIARLAVSKDFQGRGLGGILLSDALTRASEASRAVPVQAVVVHAKDDHGVQFYQQYGLLSFPDNPRYLYIPMATINGAMSQKVGRST